MFSCVCKFKLSIFYFSQSVILPTSPSKLCCCVLFLLKLIFMYLYLCLIYSTRRDLGKNQRQTCLSLLLCWPESISVLHEILLNALIGVLLSFTSSKSLQFKERKEMGSFSFLNHCMCVCGGGALLCYASVWLPEAVLVFSLVSHDIEFRLPELVKSTFACWTFSPAHMLF